MKLFIAIDLGTSTLEGQVLNVNGDVLACEKTLNPQHTLGVDILTRLHMSFEGYGDELRRLLVVGLNTLVSKLLDVSNCDPCCVVSVHVAGNSGMSCLLRNVPVEPLLFPPYKPAFKALAEVPVDEVDLGFAVPLQIFPLVSGFVGGDLVAVLHWVESLDTVAPVDSLNHVHHSAKQRINDSTVVPGTFVIDIGTNAELALWDGVRWWVTSAASGPAFEGGNIAAGMVMNDGAVTDVQLNGDSLQLTVCGGGQARGLCGSGLTALISVCRQGGLIDSSGRIISPDKVETNLSRYLVENEHGWAICFYRSAEKTLFLTQTDVRNFQFAKGAIMAGVEVLLEKAGFRAEDISRVFLTGALGTALRPEVLKRVALLPEPMLDKTSFIANGVLAGLQAYLVGVDGKYRLNSLMTTIQPFPLSGTPAFERLFLNSLEF